MNSRNLPVEPLKRLGTKCAPERSLAVAQDRAVEQFIEKCGARVAQWRSVDSLQDIERAVAEV
jgi:5-(carboxyamino)imidazole ribonucleotide synthase